MGGRGTTLALDGCERTLSARNHRLGAMPNRKLTDAELDALFVPLIDDVCGRLDCLSAGDPDLLWHDVGSSPRSLRTTSGLGR